MQKVVGLTLSPEEDEKVLLSKAAAAVGVKESAIGLLKILKKSVDARRNPVKIVYSVEIFDKPPKAEEKKYERIETKKRVVVVGAGPCGLFAALHLARRGLCPTVVERGEPIEKRAISVERFFSGGEFDPQSNAQFGEGGAGAFSDGKLNTNIGDPLMSEITEDFIRFGAPKEIGYISKPHIGSDKLKNVVAAMREEIIRQGGKFLFGRKFLLPKLCGGKVCAAVTDDGEIPADYIIFAPGHSARDTFSLLSDFGIEMEQKSFAVGVRTEQLQSVINFRQYHGSAFIKRLPPADYKLVSHASTRGVYTFCMCPGGVVVPAASEEGGVVTNGMSLYARDGKNANSAVVAQVTPADYPSRHPLAGVEFQRELERKAFIMGGGDYKAPVQLAEDFLKGVKSSRLGEVVPSYGRGYELCDLGELFPEKVGEALRLGLADMDKKLKGISSLGAVLTGVESRTSSPIRILRGENFQSASAEGFFPAGEGCGYAGGIMSAAVDGLRVARLVAEYAANK